MDYPAIMEWVKGSHLNITGGQRRDRVSRSILCQIIFPETGKMAVNKWQMQTPVTAKTRGTALSSGASTHTMSHKFDGNITPMDHMLRVLNSKRYEMIHA